MLHGVVACHLRKDIYCILVNACNKILLFLNNNRFVSITRKVNLYTVLFSAKNKLPDFFSQNCHLDRFFLHTLCGKNRGAYMRKIKASALLTGYFRSSFSRFLLQSKFRRVYLAWQIEILIAKNISRNSIVINSFSKPPHFATLFNNVGKTSSYYTRISRW